MGSTLSDVPYGEAPPSGTVTFLFTDIEGSTRRWEQSQAAMESAVRRHDALVREAISAYRGFVFKTVGDAFCAVFRRPHEAVAAAAAAQRALAQEDFESIGRLPVRMAVHTGTADERDRDYFGPAVNRVARILSIGHGGQVLLSGVTADLSIAELPPNATLRDLGQHRLRDLERPEHVYQLVLRDLPIEFGPLRSLDRLPNNLPAQLTSLIGRDEEVREVTSLLAEHRLVTLVGAGGVGKTRVSLQTAANLLDGSGDGVWFVELAPLTDGGLIPGTIAAAMRHTLSSGDGLTELTSILQPMRLLLVLDNCEHVIDAAARVSATILQRCPQVKILASSRQPLGIDGEIPYRMPSLELPHDDEAATVEQAIRYGAVALFNERARVANQRFALSENNVSIVVDICRRLDGIPLAIELAAARISMLTPLQLRQRLDERFRLLTGASRTALPRQQTLRALIDWSYDLLTQRERMLFDRFGIFVGACTLEAVTAVCAGTEIDEPDLFDTLSSLVDKSLVVPEADEYTTRYRMLESMRAYAIERLRQRGEWSALVARHLRFYRALVQSARSAYEESAREADLAPVVTDLDNIRVAAERALEENGDLLAGAHLVSLVPWALWNHREAVERMRPFAERGLDADPYVASRVWSALTPELYNLGEHRAAREACLKAVSYARLSGKEDALFSALFRAAQAAHWFGTPDEAARALDEARALAGDRPTALQRRSLLFAEAYTAQKFGDFANAVILFQQLLAKDRSLGNHGSTAVVLTNLAESEYGLGNAERAFELAQETIELLERQRQHDHVTMMCALATAYLVSLNRLTEAHELAGRPAKLRPHLLNETQAGMLAESIALAYALEGDTTKAVLLSAFSEGVVQRRGRLRERAERVAYDRLRALLRDMESDKRALLEAQGAAMSPHEALALAFP